MENDLTNNDTALSLISRSPKRDWGTPKVVLLSQGYINAKTFPQVHENTGAYVTFAVPHQYKNFSNQAGSFGINITSNGAPLGGNKTQAYS